MAARKSCTHLTWAEAKNKSGIGNGVTKNKDFLRKQNHGQLQAQKIIAKHGGDEAENRKIQKAYRKLDEKSAAKAAEREEEREQKRLAALEEVRPYDRAREKCHEMMMQLQAKGSGETTEPNDCFNADEAIVTRIVDCKRMQLDEITALESLLPEDDFCILNPSDVNELRQKLEQLDNGEPLTTSITRHPPVMFSIRLESDGQILNALDELVDLNLLAIIQVTLPSLYLSSDETESTIPHWKFRHVMVTDKNVFCSSDKPLESLALLDEKAILQAMLEYARDELLPYPCVYEVAVTWLSQHIFEYMHLRPHLCN